MDKVVIEDYLPLDNNKWKRELDETSTFIVKFLFKPQGPLLYIYLHFKICKSLFNMYILD